MRNTKKVFLTLFVLVFVCTSLFAKGTKNDNRPIIVLYTNDVHCGYTDNCGLSGVAAVKAHYEDLYSEKNVTLVDCGDAIQGDVIGTVSEGAYLVDLMNVVGYDFAILGNHEFDYNLSKLYDRIWQSKAQYLNATIKYSGIWGSNKLMWTKPYKIVNYDGIKVAYIGVSTPESFFKAMPKYFSDGNGRFVYNFCAGQELYDCVQFYVDMVRANGADYVVVLAHLGLEEGSAPNRATDLIANTTGIDVLLDGHSHDVVESDTFKNKEGKDVLYSQTGTKLTNIGVLTIGTDGTLKTEFVQTTEHDAYVDKVIAAIDAEYKAELVKVIAVSEVDMKYKNKEGARAVRNRETAIGDFCADAYRAVSGADVAFVNGGAIRADVNEGNLSKSSMISVHPFGNMLCMCEATGQEILDALEHGSRNTAKVANEGAKSFGENGGFLQVSGLKYTIDTSVSSSVVLDENGFFVGVNGERRVKDVFVGSEENGWTEIDPAKTYTVACHDYKLQNMGDGYTMFADNNYLIDKTMSDSQVLITYLTDCLGGIITAAQYGQPKGRITVI